MMGKLRNGIANLPVALKASVAFFFSSVITSGISYITTPIYTRILSAEEYGRVSVFLTWLQILGVVAMFCLYMGVFNNGMIDYPDKRDRYSFSLLALSNIITVLFGTVFLIIYPFIKSAMGLSYPLIFLMLAIFLFQPAYNFWVSRQRYEFKYKFVVLFAVLCAVVSPLTAILACLYADYGERLYPRIFGAEIPLIIIYIGFYFYIAKKSSFKVDRSFWKAALLFNLPLIPHYLSTYLLNSCDKIMISKLVGDDATAYYSVAYSVAAIATIVWNAVNSSLVPYTYEKCKEKDYKSISKVVIPILALFAVVCLFVIMLAPEVVAIMATKDYMEAVYVIPPIVGGVFFQVQYYIYANVVYFYKKPRYVMYASVLATAANVVLNYFCIRIFGYLAAGYTTLACFIIQAVADYVAMRKVVGEDVYNMKYVAALSLAVLGISLCSNLTYDYPVVRYALVVLMIVCMVIFRKKIIGLISAIKKK